MKVQAAEINLSETKGVWFDREFYRDGDIFVCIEKPFANNPYYLLDRLKFILDELNVSTIDTLDIPLILPRIKKELSNSVFAYRLQKNANLLCEVLDATKVLSIYDCLGGWLAKFHNSFQEDRSLRSQLENFLPPTFDMASSIIGQICSENREDTPLEKVLRNVPKLYDRFVRAHSHIDDRNKLILHGRWSSGAIIVDGQTQLPLGVMGGIDFWCGPAEYDLAYLVGELVEETTDHLLINQIERAADSVNAIIAFVKSYKQFRLLDVLVLIDFAVYRLVTHLQANKQWRTINMVPEIDAATMCKLLVSMQYVLDKLELQLNIDD